MYLDKSTFKTAWENSIGISCELQDRETKIRFTFVWLCQPKLMVHRADNKVILY